MLPLFPLDGFSVVRGLLPENAARQFEKTESVWYADFDVPYLFAVYPACP